MITPSQLTIHSLTSHSIARTAHIVGTSNRRAGLSRRGEGDLHDDAAAGLLDAAAVAGLAALGLRDGLDHGSDAGSGGVHGDLK